MGSLSHIADVEGKADAEQQERSGASAAQAAADDASASSADAHAEDPLANADMTAEQEEEFHGLGSEQPMGAGHKILIIVALVVLAAAILYIVNSWIHFV